MAASGTFPPRIDIVDESTTKQVAEMYRSGLVNGSHQARIIAAKFHPCVVKTLRHWGLDGSNRLGFGSDAKKVADEIERAYDQAAEHMTSAAYYIDTAELITQGRFWTPVSMAMKEYQGGHDPQVLVKR